MSAYFKTNHDLIQLSLTTYLLGFAIMQLIYGPLSDAWGRKPILLFGLSLFTLATGLCLLTSNIMGFLVYRFCQAVGSAACSVSSRSIMKDVYEPHELALFSSYIAMAWALIPIMAPTLGGYLQHFFGWQANFIVLFLFGLISLLITVFYYQETNLHQRHAFSFRASCRNYTTLLSSRGFMGYGLCTFMLYGIFSAFNTAAPFIFQINLKLSAVAYGWITFFIASGYLLGSFANSKLHILISIHKRTQLGFILAIFSIWTLLLLSWYTHRPNITIIALPMFALFVGIGLIYANCIAGCMQVFPKIAGSASAVFGSLCFIGGSLSSMIISKFPEINQIPLALTLCVLILFAGISYGFILPKQSRAWPDQNASLNG